MIVVGTNGRRYKTWYDQQGVTRNNGSYWYSRELEEIILPALNDIDCFIVTAGITLYDSTQIPDGAVIVCHDNRNTAEMYGRWFGRGMIWVCSKLSTQKTLQEHGEIAFYVPLSIDTSYVSQFKRTKRTKGTAFVGNAWGFKAEYLASLDTKIDQLSGLEREDLLKEMSKYKTVIAEGRCLMEAQVLGAKVQTPEYKALETVMVEVLDSRDAIPLWREVLEQAPTFKRVQFLVDIYPNCVGDTVIMDREQLSRVDRLAEKRRIANPYKHLSQNE